MTSMLKKLVFIVSVTHMCLLDAVYLIEDNEEVFRRDSSGTQEPEGNPTVRINSTSVRAGYVTQEVFDAKFAAITSSLDKVKWDVGSIQSSVNSLISSVGTLTSNFNNFVSKTNTGMSSLQGSVATLNNNYAKTIKHCSSGLIDVPRSGGQWTLKFNPAFTGPPAIIYSVVYYDDGLSRVRFKIDLLSISSSQATLKMSTWADSKIYKAAIRWMACK